MSIEDNKAVVVRWFTDFWGSDFDPGVIDDLAAPDIRFEYCWRPRPELGGSRRTWRAY